MKTALTEILDASAAADPRLNRARMAPAFALLMLSIVTIIAAVLAGEGVVRGVLTMAAGAGLIVSVYLPMEGKRVMRAASVVGAGAALLIVSVSVAVLLSRGGSAQSVDAAVTVAGLVALAPLVAFGVARAVRHGYATSAATS